MISAPDFWWNAPSWPARLLYPVSHLYGNAALSRLEKAPRIPVARPVICIGNPTVGGAGKTPTALALGEAARQAGLKPGFLSRGHGGRLRRPTRVDSSRHTARDVGDEPLLLAAAAPTVIARDRAAGAGLLVEDRVDLIIMDDGFQSAPLRFDYALLVIDAARGIGNGHVLPGGPLRAPLRDQIRHADALMVIGDGVAADTAIRVAGRAAKPIFEARLRAVDPDRFKDCSCLAFAAIGNPEKFFDTLRGTGARIAASRGFADHHVFRDQEIAALLDLAERDDLQIVTTSKDLARLEGAGGHSAELAAKAAVLEVVLRPDNETTLPSIVNRAIDSFKKRQIELL